MKTIEQIAILILISSLFGCNQHNKNDDKSTKNPIFKTKIEKVDSLNTKSENSKFYTDKDTLFFKTEYGDTMLFTKDEYNQIVDNHPELFSIFVYNPDIEYYSDSNQSDFDSEVGKDYYYELYSCLLKQKNGDHKNKRMRKKLVEIFQNINFIFQSFEHGGTYFMHQYKRILGYAEYSIYLYLNNSISEKPYDITKQKELYIKSLRQLIDDKMKIDNDITEEDKIKLQKELHQTVDQLNQLITDIFYLRITQEFHYSHYIYF